MKKVAILSIGDYKHITLISKYTSYFEDMGIDYDVICTDRYGNDLKRDHVISFRFKETKGKAGKIKNFLAFHNWAKKIIGKNNYDFIVIWNENTALLFADILLERYRKKYCVNIRDVDFLNQKAFNVIRAKVIRNSAFSTYCSTAPLDFPKDYKYVLMRSMNFEVLKDVPKRESFVTDFPIRIMFLGKVRFMEANEEIIRAFGNDPRFELWFVGVGSEALLPFKSEYSNLNIVGSYEPEETAHYLANADVINSYFGTKVLGYERMSSIRFSYSPYIHIPVIVGKNTNMEAEGKKYGFAYGFGYCSLSEEADRFYEWYKSLSDDLFISGCEEYCKDVEVADSIFYHELSRTLQEQQL